MGARASGAIFAARMLLKKLRERIKLLHVAFLDLEKPYDRVPCQLITRRAILGPMIFFKTTVAE